jgi:hypothetical protein
VYHDFLKQNSLKSENRKLTLIRFPEILFIFLRRETRQCTTGGLHMQKKCISNFQKRMLIYACSTFNFIVHFGQPFSQEESHCIKIHKNNMKHSPLEHILIIQIDILNSSLYFQAEALLS